MKRRVAIPMQVERELLVEAGYRCSIPKCTVDSALEFHHINGDPSNNSPQNILVVCSNHHRACTNRRIDRKACLTLKRSLQPEELRIPWWSSAVQEIRRVIRDELSPLKPDGGKGSPSKGAFVSPFDRRHLFATLKNPFAPFHEMYMAIQVLGELKYTGSTGRIIRAIRKPPGQGRRPLGQSEKGILYSAAVQSLSRLETKEALSWLADEYTRKDIAGLDKLMLFFALAGARKSHKHLGFRILDRKVETKERLTISRITFAMRGRRYRLGMEFQRP